MSNPIKDAFDETSLLKDIDEINSIISNYQRCGMLNRNDAINKITELRTKDRDIATITTIMLSKSFIPFSQSTDDQIVGELVRQRNVLQAKLVKKQEEKKHMAELLH